MSRTITSRISQLNFTAEEWTTTDPVLYAGEIGYESDTNKMKIGDGSSVWSELPYFADVDSITYGSQTLSEVLSELGYEEASIDAEFTSESVCIEKGTEATISVTLTVSESSSEISQIDVIIGSTTKLTSTSTTISDSFTIDEDEYSETLSVVLTYSDSSTYTETFELPELTWVYPVYYGTTSYTDGSSFTSAYIQTLNKVLVTSGDTIEMEGTPMAICYAGSSAPESIVFNTVDYSQMFTELTSGVAVIADDWYYSDYHVLLYPYTVTALTVTFQVTF